MKTRTFTGYFTTSERLSPEDGARAFEYPLAVAEILCHNVTKQDEPKRGSFQVEAKELEKELNQQGARQ